MKAVYLLLLSSLIISFTSYNFSDDIYVYQNDKYYESLLLNEDGSFEHIIKAHFLHIKTLGNWQKRKDSIILDSYPQKDKIIVNEDYKKRFKKGKYVFNIRDKNYNIMIYHLTVITINSDTLSYSDQWDKSIISDCQITSFYIKDTKGLKSPTYKIMGKNTNSFDILFETKRVFSNEKWLINDSSIHPIGLNGELTNYVLKLE